MNILAALKREEAKLQKQADKVRQRLDALRGAICAMARSSVCREKLCHHTRLKFLYLVATSLPYGSHADAGAWRSCGKPVGRPSNSTRLAPSFRNDVVSGVCREQLPSESKRYCEGCPPNAATWNSSGFPDANRRWADNLPSGQRFYADR